jgi:hypothetical protein
VLFLALVCPIFLLIDHNLSTSLFCIFSALANITQCNEMYTHDLRGNIAKLFGR